jgi:hypothetical protein
MQDSRQYPSWFFVDGRAIFYKTWLKLWRIPRRFRIVKVFILTLIYIKYYCF